MIERVNLAQLRIFDAKYTLQYTHWLGVLTDDDTGRKENALEHAWSYFELHANQRMTVFNFFLVLAGLVAAGLATAVQGNPRFAVLEIVLGLLLGLVSFIFWKLDQRASFLIKLAEEAIAELETALPNEKSRLFLSEPALTKAASSGRNSWTRLWTYGRSFRTTFCVIGIFGFGSSVLSALRFLGVVSWQ